MGRVEHTLMLFAAHATLLLLVLPIIGAGLVLLSAAWGTDVARRTAITNVLLSIAVALLMLSRFEPNPQAADGSPRRFQMSSEAPLEFDAGKRESPDGETGDNSRASFVLLQGTVGVDGLSLWFVALLPLVTLPGLALTPDDPKAPGLLALILLLEAALVGTFAALNVVLFAVCLELAGVLFLLIVGFRGAPDDRRGIASLAVWQTAGGLGVFLGLMLLVSAPLWLTPEATGLPPQLSFTFETLLTELRASAGVASVLIDDYWRLIETMVFWLLAMGFAITAAAFPFHARFCEVSRAWPASATVAACGLFPAVGVYGVMRLVLPACATAVESHGGLLIGFLLAGAVYAGLLAVAQSDLQRTVGCAAVAHTGLALAAVFSMTAAGVSAAVLQLIGRIAAFGILAAVLSWLSARYETLEIRAYGGLGKRHPGLAAAFFVGVLTLAGLPGLCGFPALWLMLSGFSEALRGIAAPLAILAAYFLPAWALLSAGQRIFWGPLHEPLHPLGAAAAIRPLPLPRPTDDRSLGVLAAVPLMLVVLALGLAPQYVGDRLKAVRPYVLPDEDVAANRRRPAFRATVGNRIANGSRSAAKRETKAGLLQPGFSGDDGTSSGERDQSRASLTRRGREEVRP